MSTPSPSSAADARRYYITTPIYYVNDRPHVGHAYSTVAVDVMHRFQELKGARVHFLTGTDEHGQKIERRAQEEGIDGQAFTDRMAPPFRQLFDTMNCGYDDFIRTTEPRHKRQVQALWKRLEESGDIYLGEYEGWYSVSSETFFTEKELLEGNLDPITRKPVERVREKSYFFKLSKYGPKLLEWFESHPDFVQPSTRFNEVKRFVEGGLHDLSISRTSFRWGIGVPNDPQHVVYVWLDALTNYLSALGLLETGPAGAPSGQTDLAHFWPTKGTLSTTRAVHVVGKDILRFHAVYWPAFLMAAGLQPPHQIWAHGWLTADGVKMSKSLKNFVSPLPLVDALGTDPLRYYLMRDVAFGQDGDFSHANLVARYTGDLGNGLGNLLNRVVQSILPKATEGRIPTPGPSTSLEDSLVTLAQRVSQDTATHYHAFAPHRALESIWELVSAANKYVDQTEPWALLKSDPNHRLPTVLYTVLESLRWLSVLLSPVLPSKCQDLRKQLGLPPLAVRQGLDLWPQAWGALIPGTMTQPGTPLFPRLPEAVQDQLLGAPIAAQAPPPPDNHTKKPQTHNSNGKPMIEFDDFTKVDLRLGKVLQAEAVPKSTKLLKLQVDIGEPQPRQILAGIRTTYAPEDLIGKKLVVVANLKPRKLMGLESQGMVLAASDDDGLSALFVDKDITPGVSVG